VKRFLSGFTVRFIVKAGMYFLCNSVSSPFVSIGRCDLIISFCMYILTQKKFRNFSTPDDNFSCGWWLFCVSKVLFSYMCYCMYMYSQHTCWILTCLEYQHQYTFSSQVQYCSRCTSITQVKQASYNDVGKALGDKANTDLPRPKVLALG